MKKLVTNAIVALCSLASLQGCSYERAKNHCQRLIETAKTPKVNMYLKDWVNQVVASGIKSDDVEFSMIIKYPAGHFLKRDIDWQLIGFDPHLAKVGVLDWEEGEDYKTPEYSGFLFSERSRFGIVVHNKMVEALNGDVRSYGGLKTIVIDDDISVVCQVK